MPKDEEWTGFADLEPDSDRYNQIQAVIDSANFEHLQNRALRARQKQEPNLAGLSCIIDRSNFTSGFQNVIFAVSFSDKVFWVARVPYQPIDGSEKTSLLSEISTMKIVRQRTNIPVPKVFDFEIDAAQPFGHPFILLEYLEGRTLGNNLAFDVPEHYISKVADQFAGILGELQSLTFDKIGRLWCGEDTESPVEIIGMDWHHSKNPLQTSLEYFYNQTQGENRKIMEIYPDQTEWRTTCWVLKSALPHIIIEGRVRGPFPLCHLDFHYGNFLFNEEYDLTGVIDWSSAQAAPVEQMAATPEFLTFLSLPKEENQPMVDFKNSVVKALEMLENTESQAANPLSAYLSTYRAEIVLRQYLSSPRGSQIAAKRIAELIYGQNVTWEQLEQVYGHTLLD